MKKWQVVAMIISGLTFFCGWYFGHTPFNLRSLAFCTIIGLCIAGWLVCQVLADDEPNYKPTLGVAAVFIVCGIASSMAINSSAASRVANVEKRTFDSASFPDLAEGDFGEIAMLDLDTARVLGDRKIGELEHTSWYDVDDDYSLILYQGKPYRISIIDYSRGFWKYHKAKAYGTPGYVLVDCEINEGKVSQEAMVIKTEMPIRYTPRAYFSYNLYRHLRWQYPTYIMGDAKFEIDEAGTPFWITEVKTPTGGPWGVSVVNSVLITNAQTGETEEYGIEVIPNWVDHAIGLQRLMSFAKWHYLYKFGYWNAISSKTNVLKTAYSYRDQKSDEDSEFANFFGYGSVLHEGKPCFYTGLTAANAAESNLGWLIIEPDTGKMYEYSVVGAEESSAQAAAEQLVSDYRYQATFPLPANIAGEPSYIMCLKGNAGLVQGYAICNVANYYLTVQGETLPEAINKYIAKLGKTDGEVIISGEVAEAISELGQYKFVEVEVDGVIQKYLILEDGSMYLKVK